MKKKYMLQVGTPPIRSTVEVGPQFPPMHVYQFSLLHNIKRMLQVPEYVEEMLWRFEEKQNSKGERVYDSLNSSEWWRIMEEKMEQILLSLGSSAPTGKHVICPILLFDDACLADNLGRLLAQPILCTCGLLSNKLHRLVSSWFILGMVLPYPKSSKEREADRKSKLTEEEYIKFYHWCLHEILTELRELASVKGGIPVEVHGKGVVYLHFRLCMVIGDTKGHDNMCCHYNSHSSIIAQMVRDCDIPQLFGDDPLFKCLFVHQDELEETVDTAIEVVDEGQHNEVGNACRSCKSISQHLVRSAYWDIPTGGCQYGIFASLPWEILHLFYLGIMKYLLHALYNFVEVPEPISNWCKDRWARQGQPLPSGHHYEDTECEDEGKEESIVGRGSCDVSVGRGGDPDSELETEQQPDEQAPQSGPVESELPPSAPPGSVFSKLGKPPVAFKSLTHLLTSLNLRRGLGLSPFQLAGKVTGLCHEPHSRMESLTRLGFKDRSILVFVS